MTQYDIDVRDYWRIIKKRRAVILFSMAIMCVFSFIFAKYQKSRLVSSYTSSSTVRIDRRLNLRDYYNTARFSVNDDTATEVKTITSFSVMAEAARRIGDIPDTLKDADINSDPKLLSTINTLAGMVQSERFEFTNIITINAYAFDPVRARDLAQIVAESYKDNRRKELNRQIDGSIDFIRGQIKETEDSLHIAQKEFESYSSKSEAIVPYYSSGGIATDLVDLSRRRNALDEKENSIRLMIEVLKKEGRVENAVLASAFAEGEGTVFRQKYEDILQL